jgi:hypothetical protein
MTDLYKHESNLKTRATITSVVHLGSFLVIVLTMAIFSSTSLLVFCSFFGCEYFQTVIGDSNIFKLSLEIQIYLIHHLFCVSCVHTNIHVLFLCVVLLFSKCTDFTINQSWIFPTAQCYLLCHLFFPIIVQLFHHVKLVK